ncbi:hypothetical protein [Phascolarctobacterium sp.]|uniref:hypothetical protein n=1 Tax=Phascolarctobacterium sp. TaxID=2049039 RepID=UPI0025FF63BD|nr:hypothetical protein [Phascolarctobacterium sp.]
MLRNSGLYGAGDGSGACYHRLRSAGREIGGAMAYFDTCPRCGAHNDPGERCDCSKKLIFDRYDYMDKRGTVKASNHRGGGQSNRPRSGIPIVLGGTKE